VEIEISVSTLSRDLLVEYGTIPMKLSVSSHLIPKLTNGGLGGITLTEEVVDKPYIFDYDALDSEGPARWLTYFDTGNWGLFTARMNGKLVGGATVAFNTPGVHMLFERDDIAALWDIRVQPELKRLGIGTQLFQAAVKWVKERRCLLYN